MAPSRVEFKITLTWATVARCLQGSVLGNRGDIAYLLKVKVKVQFTLEQAMKGERGVDV